jgi:hypothetical protein
MTKSKAPPPETTDAPIDNATTVDATAFAEPAEQPHDAARSNLPEQPAPPPRDYTRAKAAWQEACYLARGYGYTPATLGTIFVTDTSAPDLWERQSQHLWDFWYGVVDAASR